MRKKDNKNISTKTKLLSVAAVLLLLVGVPGILMLSGTNADGVVLPDVSVYSLWVSDDFGGCGYSDVNFFEYTDNGTIYNDFEKDVDLTDYVPPLFKNDYFNYIDEDEENTQAIQADIIAELKNKFGRDSIPSATSSGTTRRTSRAATGYSRTGA